MSQKTNYRLLLFLGAVFAVFFALTEMTPLIADDYNYAFYWAYPVRIDSFNLLIRSMGVHRRRTNGRVFAHAWVSLFMMLPRWVFSAVNASMAVLFCFTCFCFFRRTRIEKPIIGTAFLTALMWICMPVYGQVFFWTDGACNYFWGFVLAWETIYQVFRLGLTDNKNIAGMFLALPLAFAAGAWSEHISFSMLVIVFLLIVWKWIRTKHFPVRQALLLLAGCGGYLYLMLAPSMLPSILKKRAEKAIAGHASAFILLLREYWWAAVVVLASAIACGFFLRKRETRGKRLALLLKTAAWLCLMTALFFGIKALINGGAAAMVSSPLMGVFLLLGVFAWLLEQALVQGTEKEIILLSLFFSFGGFCALLLFIAAAYIPARAFCAPVLLTGISCALLFGVQQKSQRILLPAATVLFVLCFVVGFGDIMSVHSASVEREKRIQEALESNGVLAASPYPCHTKYSAQYGLQDLEPGAAWPNDMIALYYGLEQIEVSEG